jgi:hypothetical protein
MKLWHHWHAADAEAEMVSATLRVAGIPDYPSLNALRVSHFGLTNRPVI